MKGGLLNPFFQNGIDLSGYGLSSTQGVDEWILSTGVWRDEGVWQDDDTWQDS